jgi:hypothetical protein
MAKQPIDHTIVDGASLYDAADFLAERFGRERVTIDFSRLRERLNEARTQFGWRPTTSNTILLSIDTNSEGPRRFMEMLKHAGFDPDASHYRQTFISPPPGRNQIDASAKPITSLSSRISYIAGLMARHKGAQLLVVSHAFELYGPLIDLQRRLDSEGKGRVGIAYFSSLMDQRWKSTGLMDKKSGIEFFDLEDYSDELVGLELTDRSTPTADDRVGLSRF